MLTSSWLNGRRFCASSFLRWRSFLFTVCTTLVLTLVLVSTLQADLIHSRLNPAGSIMAYKVSPDGNLVASAGNYSDINNLDLYVVPIQGGPQVKVGTTDFSDRIEESFYFTPNSSHLIYAKYPKIYSARDVDGTVFELSSDLANDEYATFGDTSFRFDVDPISPDSQQVIYLADKIFSGGAEKLMSAPTIGGVPVTLAVRTSNGKFYDYRVSPDSRYVIYNANLNGTGDNLYSVPITGGPSVKLNLPLTEIEFVRQFLITHDSNRVIYEIYGTDRHDIYSVPITGGDSIQITSFDGSSYISEFTSDSSKLLLITGAQGAINNTTRYKFYLAPVNGGEAILFNTIEDSPGNIYYGPNLWLTKDERELIFVTTYQLPPDKNSRSVYRVPLDGTAATILYTVPFYDVLDTIPGPFIDEDRDYLTFFTSDGAFVPSTLVSFDLRTGNVINLDQVRMPYTSSDSSRAYLSPDGNGLVYVGAHKSQSSYQLFATSFTGTFTTTISVQNGGDIVTPFEAPVLHNGQVCVVYRVFQTIINLYSSCYNLPLVPDQKVYLPVVEK